jgi:hypothetical protein
VKQCGHVILNWQKHIRMIQILFKFIVYFLLLVSVVLGVAFIITENPLLIVLSIISLMWMLLVIKFEMEDYIK